MKRVLTAFTVAMASLVGGTSFVASSIAHADEPAPTVVVVVNDRLALKSITREELRNVYLGKQEYWSDNTTIVKAIDRPVDRDAGLAFYRDVLKMVPTRFRHYWQSQQLSGKGIAPETVASADDVLARVATTPGAVSYLHVSELPKTLPRGVTVLQLPPEKT